MANNINCYVESKEVRGDFMRCTVRMLNSDMRPLMTNEIPILLNSLKHQGESNRWDGFDYTLDFSMEAGRGFPYFFDFNLE